MPEPTGFCLCDGAGRTPLRIAYNFELDPVMIFEIEAPARFIRLVGMRLVSSLAHLPLGYIKVLNDHSDMVQPPIHLARRIQRGPVFQSGVLQQFLKSVIRLQGTDGLLSAFHPKRTFPPGASAA